MSFVEFLSFRVSFRASQMEVFESSCFSLFISVDTLAYHDIPNIRTDTKVYSLSTLTAGSPAFTRLWSC